MKFLARRSADAAPVLLAPVSLVVTLMLIAGCSMMPESKKIDYKSTGKLPTLEVPPDLTKPSRDDRYAVPDTAPKGGATYSAYANERNASKTGTVKAGAQEILPSVEKMRLERSGTQRWLVVPGTPEELWPSLKEFWQETGFLVNVETPETGVMETDWAENRAKLPQDFIRSTIGKIFEDLYSTAERDKFRTRLERGATPGTVEIYISHRGLYETYIDEGKSRTRWQPRPADPDLESEMLRRLMVRLGADETIAKAELAKTPQAERAKLGRDASGSGVLMIDDSFDRAWRRVGLALDRVNFTVEDRDRSQGVYFVRYIDPEKDADTKQDTGGFLNKLMFWESSAKKSDATSDKYRVLVKSTGTGASVQVLSREGGVDNSATGKKILSLLHSELK
jgi:outer membrane protein assembly factor BamC